jgi:hypothetical protein
MIGLKRTYTDGEIPVFQKEIEVAQGGFILDKANLAANASIPAGTCLTYNEATRVAKVVKTATVNATAAANATTYQIKKGHTFLVGDNVAKTVGGAAFAITAIEVGATHDVITVGTTIGAAAEFDVLFQSSATGATAAVLVDTPKGLLRSPLDLVAGFSQEVGAVIRGTVYERRIPGASVTMKAAMPHIVFSQSF